MKPLSFLLRGVLWTLALGAGLVAMDRLLVGPERPEGWTAVASLDALPAVTGPVLVPAYLPEALVWPPERVLRRLGDEPGWWLELAPRFPEGPRLWIGVDGSEPPEALGAVAGCLGPEGRCPAGWHALSRALPGGRTVYVVSTLETRDLARILETLQTRETGVTPPL